MVNHMDCKIEGLLSDELLDSNGTVGEKTCLKYSQNKAQHEQIPTICNLPLVTSVCIYLVQNHADAEAILA